MPIDGIGSISNEQLMAMSMMSNGQLTSDSTTSSDSSEYNNLAFQLMMQNFMDSAKSDSQQKINSSGGIVNTTDTDLENNNENEITDTINAAVNSNQIARAAQQYMAGQNLKDIPLVLNNTGSYIAGSSKSMLDNRTPEELSKIYSAVSDASKKYGISEQLILAVIKQESDFDSTCVSSAGASGLMQIMPSNFLNLGITDAYDINQNINGGTKLLKQYLNQYNGDIQMALMAYNGGPGTMQRRGVSSSDDLYKMPSETQNYVPKVIGYYENGF